MPPDFSKYVGIPFADHGRTSAGCDCWGLVRMIYRAEYGVELPDLGPIYRSTTDEDGMRAVYVAQLPEWRQVESPQAGDVALLRVRGVPIHVGVVVSENRMLHIERGLDAVVERFDAGMWANRIEGFYRHAKQ